MTNRSESDGGAIPQCPSGKACEHLVACAETHSCVLERAPTPPASAAEEVEEKIVRCWSLGTDLATIPDWELVADALEALALDLARRLEEARRELYMLQSAGVIECAVRNPAVAEYMKHWEGRTEAAEKGAQRYSYLRVNIGMFIYNLPWRDNYPLIPLGNQLDAAIDAALDSRTGGNDQSTQDTPEN